MTTGIRKLANQKATTAQQPLPLVPIQQENATNLSPCLLQSNHKVYMFINLSHEAMVGDQDLSPGISCKDEVVTTSN